MINPPQPIALREKPILFSGPMVRAILDGRKTQTRRVVKVQPIEGVKPYRIEGREVMFESEIANGFTMFTTRTIRYAVGDRLWVRETWLYYEPSPVVGQGKNELPENPAFTEETLEFHRKRIVYQSSCSARQREDFAEFGYKWRPSIFMPRWASRINLEVTGVRVERVQEISDDDCEAEGIVGSRELGGWDFGGFAYCKDAYAALWESINGKGSWEANPWVEVYEFRRVA